MNIEKIESILCGNQRKNREERENKKKSLENQDFLDNLGIDIVDWEKNLKTLEEKIRILKRKKPENKPKKTTFKEEKAKSPEIEKNFIIEMKEFDETQRKFQEKREINENKLEFLRLFKKTLNFDNKEYKNHEIAYYKVIFPYKRTFQFH